VVQAGCVIALFPDQLIHFICNVHSDQRFFFSDLYGDEK